MLDTTINDNPCGSSGNYWWSAAESDADDMLALVTAAMISGKTIAVGYSAGAQTVNGRADQ